VAPRINQDEESERKDLMHEKFREGIFDNMVVYAFQHPELQQDAESLAQWARETYGVPVEGHDPMMTLAHRVVRLIAEYHQQRAERTQSRQRKSAPGTGLPILPAWMIASAQTSSDVYAKLKGSQYLPF
jgi:hypothetical protein